MTTLINTKIKNLILINCDLRFMHLLFKDILFMLLLFKDILFMLLLLKEYLVYDLGIGFFFFITILTAIIIDVLQVL